MSPATAISTELPSSSAAHNTPSTLRAPGPPGLPDTGKLALLFENVYGVRHGAGCLGKRVDVDTSGTVDQDAENRSGYLQIEQLQTQG